MKLSEWGNRGGAPPPVQKYGCAGFSFRQVFFVLFLYSCKGRGSIVTWRREATPFGDDGRKGGKGKEEKRLKIAFLSLSPLPFLFFLSFPPSGRAFPPFPRFCALGKKGSLGRKKGRERTGRKEEGTWDEREGGGRKKGPPPLSLEGDIQMCCNASKIIILENINWFQGY